MKKIALPASPKTAGLGRTLEALSEVLGVRFVERSDGDNAGIDAWVFPDADQAALKRVACSGRPCYTVARDEQLVPRGEASVVEFSRHPALPTVLRGRQVIADEAGGMNSLPRAFRNMTVLASRAEAPLWAMQEVEGRTHHYVAAPLPELNDGEPLFQYFHRGKFLQLLPFLLFLRDLADDKSWEPPPLQACFMFDDPNLHWRTYGFVDFAEMAAHAKRHNYHASFATIPLDAWFVHKPTARLFQRYRAQLSLLMHGNNHSAEELARPSHDEAQKRNLGQALGRIAEFESRSGVEVSRVMAPPHGACNEQALGEMARLGFEAATVSRGSLRHYNGRAAWLRALGMKPSDLIAGLPVFPRFPLSAVCHNSILLSALLRQPVIPVGHHHDVAHGLRLLGELAEFVNSLGTVHWADMKCISRAHYARCLDGKDMHIKMFTRRIEVSVPEGTRRIRVQGPWPGGTQAAPLAWKFRQEAAPWRTHHPDEPISVLPGQEIDVVSEATMLALPREGDGGSLHPWSIVRRHLTEARDRVAPLLRRGGL